MATVVLPTYLTENQNQASLKPTERAIIKPCVNLVSHSACSPTKYCLGTLDVFSNLYNGFGINKVGITSRVPGQYLAGERAERETELIHERETEPRGEFIMDYLGSIE